jgi:hypothetical protein
MAYLSSNKNSRKISNAFFMMSSYGQDPFALKKCLSGDALRTVKGVDDDFTEMFHRLDIKYGRPEKQTDAVLNEIKKIVSYISREFGSIKSFYF